MQNKRTFPYGIFGVLLIVMLFIGFLCSGLLMLPEEMDIASEESFIWLFTHIHQLWNDKTVGFMGIAVLIWMYLICYYLQYHRNFHSNPYGSAGWRDAKEACEYYMDNKNPTNNRILTQNLCVSLSGPLPNNNMLLVASSGDFKTTSVAENNLLQFASSYIMLDVKGDTLRKLGKKFKKEGYNVRSLNFKQPEKSDRYNPFIYIEKEDDLLRTTKSLFDACRPPEHMSNDPFWDEGVKLYLNAIFEAVWLSKRETGVVGTMNDVLRLANMETKHVQMEKEDGSTYEITELQIYMDKLAEKFGKDYPPVRDYRKLKDGAAETVSTLILMLNTMLQICETAEVKRIFAGNDINIREIGSGVGGDPNKKTILFLVVPDTNSVYNWIISMFYNQSIDILCRHADDELHKPLPIRVEFWLDEVYAGAKPDNLVQLLGTVRSRNLCLIPILQSRSQIKDMFKEDKAEIIMDNIATLLFLGCGRGAIETQKWISELLGQMTVDTQHDNITSGSNGHSTLDFNQIGRELMRPEEVGEMPLTDAIVFLKGSKPIYDTKAIPFNKPDLDYKAPKWLKERLEEAVSYGTYEHPVHTIYDPIHFNYITVEPDEPYQIITDKQEIETYREAAKRDESIYTYTIDESELLYLSWGHGEYTQERVKQIYDEIQADKEARRAALKGLIVLQNRDDIDEFLEEAEKITDKSGWDKYTSLSSLIKDHWDDMSAPEQEQISLAFAEELTEEQILKIAIQEYAKMALLRDVYLRENREVG